MLVTPALILGTIVSWFGPEKVSFPAAVTGNPWDPAANDVRVAFTAADGKREERIAYYDRGSWNAVLTAPQPGDYTATLLRNGQPTGAKPAMVHVGAGQRLPTGFVRAEGAWFHTDDGALYFPLGHNLAWRNSGEPPIPERLHSMHAAGMNWTRIWACAWDGKNPVFSPKRTAPAGEFLPEALEQWDTIVKAAEDAGMRFQFVLFHHGLFSTTNDSNWAQNPWNRANGGFIDKPEDFFTDPRAKEYARRWLRLAVARWGHSPAIMAWELFNEVEWTDAAQAPKGWKVVAAWHAEMAAYLRSLDPYHHLVVSSAARQHPELYASLNYFQPHAYPKKDVYGTIAGLRPLSGKPAFFGEFGRGTEQLNPDERLVLRDGVWAGILSGQSGAAQYWFWDRVQSLKLDDEYERAAQILRQAAFQQHPERHPQQASTSDPKLNVHAFGDQRFSLVRITAADDAAAGVSPETTVRITGLADGAYRLTTTNLDTGARTQGDAAVKDGELRLKGLGGRDVAVLIVFNIEP